MQVDRPHADTALPGQGLAQPVERLGKTLGRRGDKQWYLRAGIDFVLQRLGLWVAVRLGLIEVCLQDALGQLGIAAVGGMTGVGQCDAQRALIVGGNALVGGACLGATAADVADQRSMIAQIELGPVGQLRGIEQTQRLRRLALGFGDPGAGHRTRQFADRVPAHRP